MAQEQKTRHSPTKTVLVMMKCKSGEQSLLTEEGWSLTSHIAECIPKTSVVSDHPVCAVSVASRHFLTGAATPPQ